MLTNKKAIIAAHLTGWPSELDEVLDIANANKLYAIEDCDQTHGATINGKSVGSFGFVSAWSF